MNPQKDQLFTKAFHNKLQSSLEKEYMHFIDDVREDLKNGFTTDIVDTQFLDQLNDIIHDEVFDKYSPLKFYWMNLLDNLIYIIQLHEEILNSEEYNEDNRNLSDAEEELSALWNDSEFSKTFNEMLSEGTPVIEASDQLISLYENQIIAFYVLHINQFQQEFDDAIVYQSIKEIGDSEKRIYLSDSHHYVELNPIPESFPSLPIKSFKPNEDTLTFEIKEEDINFKIKKNPFQFKFENQNYFLLPNCELGIKKAKSFLENIEEALKCIKIANPKLCTLFTSFTHTVVPINEEGIVSYSLPALPGFSCLNMFEGDLIDLMDNLVHQSAAHMLNTANNINDLVVDNDDKQYYSPWKRTLKPIKSIYTSFFNFYFSFELFHSLNKAIESKSLKINKEDSLKIKSRTIEEFYFLKFASRDLEQAAKLRKITKFGSELILPISQTIKTLDKEMAQIEENLKKSSEVHYEHILFVKKNLDKALHE